MTNVNDSNLVLSAGLINDTSAIIEQTKAYAYRAVNVFLTIRNWLVGERISRELLEGETRAKYGERVIGLLSVPLTEKYGKGFDRNSLHKYVKFYRLFPEIKALLGPKCIQPTIGDTESPQLQNIDLQYGCLLPWAHYRELIRVEDNKVRKWYEQEALREGWSVRTLHRKIDIRFPKPATRFYKKSSCHRISWLITTNIFYRIQFGNSHY